MAVRREMMVALVLGLIGLGGVAMMAMGQGGAASGVRGEYEAKLAKLDKSKVDELVALAKWCLTKELTDEARSNALEALEKAPDDVRAKYIVFATATAGTTPSGTGGGGTGITVAKAVTISDADAQKVFADEGLDRMSVFAQKVMPVMMAKCGSAKCHGGDDKASKFNFITQNLNDRKVVAENFLTVAKYLNRETKDKLGESLLLTITLKGPDAKHPLQVFKVTSDPSYKIMDAWVRTVKTDVEKMWSGSTSTPPPLTTP